MTVPVSGATADEMRRRLSLKTIKEFQPDPVARRQAIKSLWASGFEVFDEPGPVLACQGTVKVFSEVFHVQLVKRTRKMRIPGTRRIDEDISIELPEGVTIDIPQDELPGVLIVSVAQAPKPSVPLLPAAVAERVLHLPGDIALLTQAAAAHRQPVGEDRATGVGVTVAVIDTGFAVHPYLTEHGYRIHRIAASGASNPSRDPGDHGAAMLAGIFACAPDAEVLAVKSGKNFIAALNLVLAHPEVRVLSLSWGWDQGSRTTLQTSPIDLFPIQTTILTIIASGVTVIASTGNDGEVSFPGMMPDVIAVGGVTVDEDDRLLAWEGASSFESLIYPDRRVPDLCGIASDALLPSRLPDTKPDWQVSPGATSLATAQVAGVAALLLQKKPSLTPDQVRHHLVDNTTDVRYGESATEESATKGDDPATGAGLVNALRAWNSVY